MSKRKSFGSYVPQGLSPIEIEIGGEVFKVRATMSGLQLLHIVKVLSKDDDIDTADVLIDFVEKAVLAQDRERLLDYLENAEPPVPLATIMEIITYLIEQYSGKPTEQSQPSADGSSTSGSGSTVSALPAESTSKPSKAVKFLPSEQPS